MMMSGSRASTASIPMAGARAGRSANALRVPHIRSASLISSPAPTVYKGGPTPPEGPWAGGSIAVFLPQPRKLRFQRACLSVRSAAGPGQPAEPAKRFCNPIQGSCFLPIDRYPQALDRGDWAGLLPSGQTTTTSGLKAIRPLHIDSVRAPDLGQFHLAGRLPGISIVPTSWLLAPAANSIAVAAGAKLTIRTAEHGP